MSRVGTARDDSLATVAQAVGESALSSDAAELTYFEHDVFQKGAPLLAVFRPTDTQMLARGVAAATARGDSARRRRAEAAVYPSHLMNPGSLGL